MAFAPSLDEFKRFALDGYDRIKQDPLAAAYWALVWACGFCITFLLVRMFFTRWGDRDITKKTLGVSLLVHLLVGMVSNSVVFGPGLSRDSEPGGALTIAHVIVDGGDPGRDGDASDNDRRFDQSQNLPGSSPAWEQAPKLAARPVERQQSPGPETGTAEMVPEKHADGAQPLAMTAPDVAERTRNDVAPEPQREAPKLNRPAETTPPKIGEETADARPEANVRAGTAARTAATAPAGEPPAYDAAPARARAGKSEPMRVTADHPAVSAGASQAADPKVPSARRSNSTESPRMGGTSPKSAPIDAGGTDSPAADGSGLPVGQKFSRTGQPRNSIEPGTLDRPGSGGSTSQGSGGLPDRGQGAVPAGSGLAGAPLASRIGGGDATDGLTPTRIRSESDGAINKNGGRVPAPYRLRTSPQRKKIAVEMGANEESERAVEISLQWLAAHQNPRGYWEPIESTLGREPEQIKWDSTESRGERERSGFNSETGLTALAVLAFLGKGYTHEDNPFAENVDRALRWLVAQQDSQGFLGGNANKYARMYCHGMATIALGEAYGMTKDRTLREPLARAAPYIISSQYPDGSWRYTDWRILPSDKRQADMSMFGWQLMALKSAKTAGLEVPESTFKKAIDFLLAIGDSVKLRKLSQAGGLASYRLGEQPKPSMTAESLFCKQMLGITRTNRASIEAVEYLQKNLPTRSKQDLYYWYYGTLAMYHHGGDAWQRWNQALRDNLVADQRTDGDFAGSWNPRSPWGDYGGRVFSTAVSTLCLEVYYRFLPLYQMEKNEKLQQSSAK